MLDDKDIFYTQATSVRLVWLHIPDWTWGAFSPDSKLHYPPGEGEILVSRFEEGNPMLVVGTSVDRDARR